MPIPQLKCCPEPDDSFGSGPLTYVDSTGMFFNMYLNSFMNLTGYYYVDGSGTPHTVAELYGKCVRTQPSPNAYGPFYDPIECPCCPDGYVYVNRVDPVTGNIIKICASLEAPLIFTNSIPCVDCICEDPAPTEVECETCNKSSGAPIHFEYNPFIKQCVDCEKEEYQPSLDKKLNCFLPYLIIFPNINNYTTE